MCVMSPKRIVPAREILQSVREGLNREQLMERHGLSSLYCDSVLKQIQEERDRRASQIINDFTSGMEIQDIAAKNGFPAERFIEILRTALSLEFERPSVMTEESELLAFQDPDRGRRRHPRILCPVLTRHIRDASFPETQGTIVDMSEKGLSVRGLNSEVDEDKIFLIGEGGFDLLEPIVITGTCRWKKEADHPAGWRTAGFEIRAISDADERYWRSLIDAEESMVSSQYGYI